ncbi:hypothetical protein AJ79_06858 [Helicocarpus griseus UAMH5409]|uniref:Uncharacterized protein n=1 Tax=Helicocarpus griseus UAMH5409 TaxID=1447875 RepID=A0A2B7X957_9EURO|nr:hypothetical protein AJ79_06858 [Helicocarpus griseus UAMH5409]
MAVAKYEDRILDCTIQPSLENLKEKSVIVTGGASGLGRGFVQAFTEAGAFVTFGDVDEETGSKLATELAGKAQFVKCDVRSWEEQVLMFETAAAKSPSKSCDIVIANAGRAGPDGLFADEDPSLLPTKPDTTIFDINVTGALYTAKLALHYFRRQKIEPGRDRCLILIGSLAGFMDLPGSATYSMSKFGVRALMRSLRRNAWVDSIRVNLIAPGYIITPAYPAELITFFASKGVKFASGEDASKATLRIASDQSVNGRSLAVVSREDCAEGYLDLAQDDYPEGSQLRAWQELSLKIGSRE